jgi:hypothetical protein
MSILEADVLALIQSHLDIMSAIRLASASAATRRHIWAMVHARPELLTRRVALELASVFTDTYFRVPPYQPRVNLTKSTETPVHYKTPDGRDHFTFQPRAVPLRKIWVHDVPRDRMFACIEYDIRDPALQVCFYCRPGPNGIEGIDERATIVPAADATGTVAVRGGEVAYDGNLLAALSALVE